MPVAEADGAYHFVNRNSGKVPGRARRLHRGRRAARASTPATAPQRSRFTFGGGTTDPHPAPRLGSQRRRLRPVDVVVSIQSKLNSVFAQQGDQPVRRGPPSPAVQAGTYSANAQRRLLHPGRGPRSLPGRRDDQRLRARGGRLVPGQRHAELLALGGEHVGQPDRRHRPLGRLAGPPRTGACTCAAASRARRLAAGRRRLISMRRSTARSAHPPAAVPHPQLPDGRLVGLQLEHGLRRRPGRTANPSTYTTSRAPPTIRERPFLYVDRGRRRLGVFVPAPAHNATGTTWGGETPAACVAPARPVLHRQKPGATAADMNAALASGPETSWSPASTTSARRSASTRPRHGRPRHGPRHPRTGRRDHRDQHRGRRRRPTGPASSSTRAPSAPDPRTGSARTARPRTTRPTRSSSRDFFVRIGGATVRQGDQVGRA